MDVRKRASSESKAAERSGSVSSSSSTRSVTWTSALGRKSSTRNLFQKPDPVPLEKEWKLEKERKTGGSKKTRIDMAKSGAEFLWKERWTLLELLREQVLWVWHIVNQNKKMKWVALCFGSCVTLCTISLSAIVLLTVIESALLVASGIVGVALLGCVFVVPLLCAVLMSISVCCGVCLTAYVLWHVVLQRQEIVEKIAQNGAQLRTKFRERDMQSIRSPKDRSLSLEGSFNVD